jgi:hypothetical protein
MHSVVIYHLLIHFSHPPSPHLFQCWHLATRHQVFVNPTLNWGNGGRYSFQIIWNYSSCPIVSGNDCSHGPIIHMFYNYTQLLCFWYGWKPKVHRKKTSTYKGESAILPWALTKNMYIFFWYEKLLLIGLFIGKLIQSDFHYHNLTL